MDPRAAISKALRHDACTMPAFSDGLGSRWNTRRRSRAGDSAWAFTLLELLVVMVVIAILVGAVLHTSTVFINDAHVKNTRAVLTIVREALDQFQSDQSSKGTVTRVVQGAVKYEDRYGKYPPDELEVFTSAGLPGAGPTDRYSLAGRTAQVQPGSMGGAMRFYRTGIPEEDNTEHRDLAAMVLAIELFSESAQQILSRVPERNWSPGATDAKGVPMQFLDRPPAGSIFGEGDEQIRYVLDDWGNPLGYMAQRDWAPPPLPAGVPPPAPSSNHPSWNQASTEMVRLNGGHPIAFSYGPNGKEQLSKTWMKDTAEASLPADWLGGDVPRRIDHPLNADNVYVDPSLNDKLAKGSP